MQEVVHVTVKVNVPDSDPDQEKQRIQNIEQIEEHTYECDDCGLEV